MGAGPEAFKPWSSHWVDTMAKQSPPSPQDTGSTKVMAIAPAMAASIADPPLSNICTPACAASGCEVETPLRANTGVRMEGYGLSQLNDFMTLLTFNLTNN